MLRDRRLIKPFGVAGFLFLTAVLGCSNDRPGQPDLLRLDLDRADPRSFISYYFGGLASPEAVDPFESNLVSERAGTFFVDTAAVHAELDGSFTLDDANNDGVIDWDELEPFLRSTYYARRSIPLHLDSLTNNARRDGNFVLSVDGVMTSARRHIRMPLVALTDALEHYSERGDRLIYPQGTLVVADHHWEGRLVERSVMIKRSDGYWDFAVYDSAGVRAPATTTPPKPLAVPTQCAGCHLGSRLYEPEKSFPGEARPGPAGPRKIHWDGPQPGNDLVRHFDEHRKRSDGILGIYGTLYVSDLMKRRTTDSLTKEESELLQLLGL